MKSYRSNQKQVNKIITRVTATCILFGAVGCILLVAIGGAFSTSSSEAKHGTHIVAPRTGDVWQVGELHTVQWTMNDVPTTNKSGDPLLAKLILSYAGTSPNSHVLLAHLTDWFPITDRLMNILVPAVPTREDYSLYLFSHDNSDVSSWGGAITIFNPENVEGTAMANETIVVTTAPPVSVTHSLTSTFSDSDLTTLKPSSTTTSRSSSTSGSSSSGSGSASGTGSASASATVTGSASATATGTGTGTSSSATVTDTKAEGGQGTATPPTETEPAPTTSPTPPSANSPPRMRRERTSSEHGNTRNRRIGH
ncbi:hypothetical protein C8Q76DRAFT_323531 [Earliella scabrosa]|nr:hypothetical protein C8Q76DRAFT_323531 [Earliella scabrosa]